MRKARAVLVSVVMLLGVSLTIGATPVYAEQNGQLVGVFKDHPECERIGTHGVHHDWWNDYTCQWESRYRYYFLYV